MNIILGSRTYSPLSDVDADSGPDSVAFGVSDIALRSETLGSKRKPLETTRSTLITMAAEPNAHVILFCARDPKTKQLTEGMAGIQKLLTDKEIPFRVVSSPFPGAICSMITDLRHAVDLTVKYPDGVRRDSFMGKAMGYSAIVNDERAKYLERLNEGFDFRAGDEELDTRWIKWLRTYEILCNALTDAERMLV